jgi:hypothetical protein
MRRIWLILGTLPLVMLGTAVVSVVVITTTWPTLPEEEQLQPIYAVAFFPDGRRFATMNNAGPVRFALMYAEEFRAGIAVVSEVESAKELMRVGETPRPSAEQQSK